MIIIIYERFKMKLKNAGEGLPLLERLCIKNILIPIVRVLFTWDIALYFLKRELKIIKKLIEQIDENLLEKQVIINRAFAIEDHSRQYSISMVCEHLTITGMGILNIIVMLSQEQKIGKKITIESVKPQSNSKEAIKKFYSFMEKYENVIKTLDKKQSKEKAKHPWFVEFNNFDWSIFMYMHTFIHRRQIEEIINVLGVKNVK